MKINQYYPEVAKFHHDQPHPQMPETRHILLYFEPRNDAKQQSTTHAQIHKSHKLHNIAS